MGIFAQGAVRCWHGYQTLQNKKELLDWLNWSAFKGIGKRCGRRDLDIRMKNTFNSGSLKELGIDKGNYEISNKSRKKYP